LGHIDTLLGHGHLKSEGRSQKAEGRKQKAEIKGNTWETEINLCWIYEPLMGANYR